MGPVKPRWCVCSLGAEKQKRGENKALGSSSDKLQTLQRYQNNHDKKQKWDSHTLLSVWTPLAHRRRFAFLMVHISNSESQNPPNLYPQPPTLFYYLHFLFLTDAPVGLALLFHPLCLPLRSPCLFLRCLCIYAHRSWPKVNRQRTMAHSTGSTVIQPSGQDLSQTSNNMLNHWVL